MARATPEVQQETLTWQDGTEVHQLTVGTTDWYAWLERASTFAFTGPTGTFTARKEHRQRGGAYWKAYRKRAGKLRRAYLGKSNALTLTRLQMVATALAGDADLTASLSKAGEQRRGEQQTWNGISSPPIVQPPQAEPIGKKPQQSLLPVPLTPLIGREEETAQVCTLLKQPLLRLVTLVGPGGGGKTRLALQVAIDVRDAFPSGVFFVPLASIRDHQPVIATIAQTLGLPASDRSSILERVQAHAQDKQLLLILDNLEHLLEAASELEQLLVMCPGVKLLVTSRMVLHIPRIAQRGCKG